MHNNTFDTGTHLCICSVLQDKCIKQSRANLLCKSWEIKRTSAKSFPRLIEVFHICGLDSSTINWCGLIYSFEFLSAKRALTFNSRKCDITMYYGHFRGIAVCLLIINVYCPDGLTNNIVLAISSIGMNQIKLKLNNFNTCYTFLKLKKVRHFVNHVSEQTHWIGLHDLSFWFIDDAVNIMSG